MDGVRTLPGAPPRRGSFQEDIDLSLAGTSPSKNGTPSISAALQADNNAVSNNHALSVTSTSIDLDDDDDDAMLTDDDPGFMKSAPASRQNSMMPLTASQPRPSLTQSPPTDGDVIEVNQNAFQLPLDPASRGKLKNRYIMPDGSVINGKGLGRGRPGVKRGPRKSALSREITETGSDAAVAASTPSPAPQAKQVSAKRKRKDSDVIKADDEEDDEEEDDDLDDFSRESTPEYNPAAATHTRSGRQSQKPAPIITQVMSTASPSTKRPAITPSTSSPSIRKHPKIKPKIYRGREQFALCEHCLRQHGPPGNVIVFCDACNKCWHQRCHDPRIPKELVEDTKAEWFCTACDKILHPKRKTKALPKPTAQIAQSTPPPTIVTNAMPTAAKVISRYGLPLVPGMSLTLAQRKDYLNSLAKERLIEIILQAANLAPNMPIFETPLHLTPQFLPGQPYPIFVQPQPPTQTPPQLQSQPQPQPQPQPEASQPDNQLHPPATPQPFNMSVASMPPPPPPSQLPPHLRAQFTSSVAASGHMPPQPASSSSSVPTISDSPSTSTPPVQPSFSASNPLSTPAPTNTNTNTTNNRTIYTHPTAGNPTKPNTQPPPPALPSGPSTTNPDPDADEEDEGYYDDFDEMALLYPKPGQGAYDLAMPPESSDLGIMLEGPDCVTFSHVVY